MTAEVAPAEPEVIKRHALVTRITHWINLICLTVLLMSGLQIFNAHPMLHWGLKGSEFDGAIFQFHFPKWATIPSWRDLTTGRLWHFFFAWLFVTNGLVYLIHGVVQRPLPARPEAHPRPVRQFPPDRAASPPAEVSQGRGIQALQRAAEAGLHRRADAAGADAA